MLKCWGIHTKKSVAALLATMMLTATDFFVCIPQHFSIHFPPRPFFVQPELRLIMFYQLI
jgi:hypothetical protein